MPNNGNMIDNKIIPTMIDNKAMIVGSMMFKKREVEASTSCSYKLPKLCRTLSCLPVWIPMANILA